MEPRQASTNSAVCQSARLGAPGQTLQRRSGLNQLGSRKAAWMSAAGTTFRRRLTDTERCACVETKTACG
jgi:hypothetical protein